MIDQTTIYENFLVIDGFLYRKHRKGAKKISYLHKGFKSWVKPVLLATFNYLKFPARDIAWAWHYGTWPTHQIKLLNGDPFDVSADNLMPKLGLVYRFSFRERKGLFFHKFSEQGFIDKSSCRTNWDNRVKHLYSITKSRVLALEAQKIESMPAIVKPEITMKLKPKKTKPIKLALRKTKRPEKIEGRVWGFYQGTYYDLPMATSIEDDIMLRAKKHSEQT